MTEDQILDLLNSYKQKQAKLQVLGTYSVGGGIQISRLSDEDHLQQLHRKLRGLPSYMYLTKKEQTLEATAHAYLTFYPAGVRAQRNSIPDIGAYQEDDELLKDLRAKIAKVIDARAGCKYDLDEVLERLAELQDLRAEIKRMDDLLEALAKFKPELSLLLKLRYQDGLSTAQVAARLHISEATYRRRKRRAISELLEIS